MHLSPTNLQRHGSKSSHQSVHAVLEVHEYVMHPTTCHCNLRVLWYNAEESLLLNALNVAIPAQQLRSRQRVCACRSFLATTLRWQEMATGVTTKIQSVKGKHDMLLNACSLSTESWGIDLITSQLYIQHSRTYEPETLDRSTESI